MCKDTFILQVYHLYYLALNLLNVKGLLSINKPFTKVIYGTLHLFEAIAQRPDTVMRFFNFSSLAC